jgi:hypothetical protein
MQGGGIQYSDKFLEIEEMTREGRIDSSFTARRVQGSWGFFFQDQELTTQ